VRILLVDDHGLVRRGVREILAEEYPKADFDEAATGEDALELASKHTYELIVLDISMPRRGGLDALKELQAGGSSAPVIVLSQHAEDQYAVRSIRAGARAYLTKTSAPEELVRAARKVLAGGKYLTESLAERLADALDVDRQGAPHESLSDRELQVLRMIGSGKAVRDIAQELALSEKTVSTYRSRVLEKMKLSTNAELMRYALDAGLVD
jgi:DNA-binding NarL/FixJ family response regulator